METGTASATSPEIVLLLIAAAAATFWMFIWKTRTDRRTTRLIVWIWENYPDRWRALPWLYRYLLRGRALREIARSGAMNDPHFAREYALIVPLPRHIRIAGAIAGVAIALILIGTRIFGWHW